MKPIALLFAVLAFHQPLLAQDPARPSPGDLFERAAYAEEHERDLPKAALLYRDAADSAQGAGDASLAKQALTALQRVETRLGRSLARNHESRPSQDPVQNRLDVLMSELGRVENKSQVIKKIIAFGAAAVPRLEAALSDWRADLAARALTSIDAPEAKAALLRGMASADPVLRSAIVGAAADDREVLSLGLKDPVPSVVAIAVQKLARIDDPALKDVMLGALQREETADEALDWLLLYRIDDIPDLLKRRAMTADAFNECVKRYVSHRGVAPSRRLTVLLDLVDSEQDVDVAGYLLACVAYYVIDDDIAADLKERVEGALLRWPDLMLKRETRDLVVKAGGRRAAEALMRHADAHRLLEEDTFDMFIDHWAQRLDPKDFGVAQALAVRYQHARPNQQLNGLYNIWRASCRGVSDEDLMRAHDALPESLRGAYVTQMLRRACGAPAAFVPLALRMEPPRSDALKVISRSPEKYVALAPDVARLLADPAVNPDAGFALGRLASVDRGVVLGHVRDLLATLNPAGIANLKPAFWELPIADALMAVEGSWAAADDARRRAMIDNLNPKPTPELAAFFIRHYKDLSGAAHRVIALRAFGATLHEPALEVVGTALSDPNLEVREQARAVLTAFRRHREALEEYRRWKAGDAEGQKSIVELLQLLENPNKDVVIGAVRALAALKAKVALPALVRLLDRPDPELKREVQDAIAAIGS